MEKDRSAFELSAGLAICGEPRAGSTYLAQLMRSTGVMGDAFEFLTPLANARRAERDPGFLLRCARRAATPNGIYALKIFAYHFDCAERSRWAERLPNLRFVHLTRDDTLGQAISLVRAMQTGRYHAGQSARAEPRYDARRIARTRLGIIFGQARWSAWFERNRIQPCRLTYEALAADPRPAIRDIARLLGLEEPPRIDPSRVEAAIVRDELTEEWRERFLDEMGDRSWLDIGMWRLPTRLRRLRAALSR